MRAPRSIPALVVLLFCAAYWFVLCLRWSGVIEWSWWLLFSPIWFPSVALLLLCGASWAGGLFFALVGHVQGWRYHRSRPRR